MQNDGRLNTDEASTHRTAALFPSLGFFGGNDHDALTIPVDEPVSRIVLRMPETTVECLDLRGIHLHHKGKIVATARQDKHLRQSSYRANYDRNADPFALQRILTDTEAGAWWLVRFARPVEADQLRIYNRTDRYGYRARQLIVEGAGPGQPWHKLATVGGSADVERLSNKVEELTGLCVDPERTVQTDVRTLRSEMMQALAEITSHEPLSRDLDTIRLLLALIPSGHGRSRPRLSDDERTVFANLLTAQFAFTKRTPTSVASFAFALSSRAELDRLVAELAKVSPVFGVPPLLVTRHGLRAAKALSSAGEEYLDLIERARADLDRLGLPLMLCYGTLLGAVRESDFLAHDDDVDLLYPLSAAGPDDARPKIEALCAQLRDLGWRVWRNSSPRALNFHLIDIRTGRRLDLFPALLHERSATLHMERMELRSVPREMILPVRPHMFRGRRVDVPADPEGFLAERYGPSWSISDPYDDWAWPLNDTEDVKT